VSLEPEQSSLTMGRGAVRTTPTSPKNIAKCSPCRQLATGRHRFRAFWFMVGGSPILLICWVDLPDQELTKQQHSWTCQLPLLWLRRLGRPLEKRVVPHCGHMRLDTHHTAACA
jgi:hypothetical protein